MDLYDDPSTVAQAPAIPAAGPDGPGYFTDGAPGSQAPTVVRGWWLNGLSQEIRNVIVGAGLTPARAIFNQLWQAIQAAIQGGATNYAVDTSQNANTVIVALTPQPAALTDGLVVRVKVANTSTGAATLTLGTLGNFPIGRNGQGLTPGDLVAGVIHEFAWQDGRWDLQSPAPMTAEAMSFASYCVDQSTSVNQVVAVPDPMPAALEDGLSLRVRAAHTSTGATTFTLGGLGATPILSRGMALYPGALQAGLIYGFTYNQSLGGWEVQSQTSDRIIKTGTATLPASGGVVSSVNVEFDAAFPDGVDHISITAQGQANSSMGGNPITGGRNVSATGFTIQADTNTGSLPTNEQIAFNQTVPVTWTAFGH